MNNFYKFYFEKPRDILTKLIVPKILEMNYLGKTPDIFLIKCLSF